MEQKRGKCQRNLKISKKFEVRKLKYVGIGDQLMDVKFVMGILRGYLSIDISIDTYFR